MQHMAQELTSVFVAASGLILLFGLRALAAGEMAWLTFLANLNGPLMLLILVGTLYHSVTWFAVTPKAMPIQTGDSFLPGIYIAGAHYLAWAVVSLFILYFAGAF